MKPIWSKLVKWAASQAFTWGLKKLNEHADKANPPKPRPRRSSRPVH
jgi:hypothetical protein